MLQRKFAGRAADGTGPDLGSFRHTRPFIVAIDGYMGSGAARGKMGYVEEGRLATRCRRSSSQRCIAAMGGLAVTDKGSRAATRRKRSYVRLEIGVCLSRIPRMVPEMSVYTDAAASAAAIGLLLLRHLCSFRHEKWDEQG
jgi:hypothetical protein